MVSPTRLAACFASIAILLVSQPAYAAPQTLTDVNATFVVDAGSQAGASSWVVDGTQHLNQQWFWYRIGNGTEASIDTLTLNSATASDNDADAGNETLTLSYSGTGFDLDITYVLSGLGAGTGQADIDETIVITSTSAGPLDITFFQYTDLELNGNANDDLIFVSGGTATQQDFTSAFSETIDTPSPDFFEVGTGTTTLDKLNDGAATTLSGAFFASGDVTWAFQWDFEIDAMGGQEIVKNKFVQGAVAAPIIPEPSTGLVFAGLLGFAVVRRRLADR